MKTTHMAFAALLAATMIHGPKCLAADEPFWRATSPDHGQTFSYGMETHRVWKAYGRDRHLTLLLDYTNDPFVDRDNPRQYDSFTFSFPDVTLGADGHFFYFHAPDGRRIAVAQTLQDFLGVDEIRLLPDAGLVISKPHGVLTVSVVSRAGGADAE